MRSTAYDTDLPVFAWISSSDAEYFSLLLPTGTILRQLPFYLPEANLSKIVRDRCAHTVQSSVAPFKVRVPP